MPPRIAQLPQDPKGMPVPYTVWRKPTHYHDIATGQVIYRTDYQFAVNDHNRTIECADNKLCSICGHGLQDDDWVIGGPLSAFMPNGVFADLPIHYECGKYALKVCPYLAVPSYVNLKDAQKIANKTGMPVNTLSAGNTRVPFFVFAKLNKWHVRYPDKWHVRYPDVLIVPDRNVLPVFLKFEYWNHGEQITPEEAVKLQLAAAPAVITLLDPD